MERVLCHWAFKEEDTRQTEKLGKAFLEQEKCISKSKHWKYCGMRNNKEKSLHFPDRRKPIFWGWGGGRIGQYIFFEIEMNSETTNSL